MSVDSAIHRQHCIVHWGTCYHVNHIQIHWHW